MIEGASVGTHVNIGPLSGFAAGSEFVADNQGNGIYSSIFTMNPSGTYTTVLLLYLPNGQMEGSVLVATASLG